MIKLDINKKKIIPNPIEYLKILLFSIISFYLVRAVIYYFIPLAQQLSEFWDFVLFAMIAIYLEELFDIHNGGKIFSNQ